MIPARLQSSQAQASGLVERVDLDAARAAVRAVAIRTPVIPCGELSGPGDGPVLLKAECLQLTGSFKLRGVLSRIASLGAAADAGLLTASAGNHARAVAEAARRRGVGCEVYMPSDAPVSKVLAAEALGAHVRLAGSSIEQALEQAQARAGETGMAFIHPFDDLDVIAGQGTVGLELLEQVEGIARVLVPLGGGGLAAGIGAALRRAGSRAELIGVQARSCAPYAEAIAGRPHHPPIETTIADGIAVKRPGEITLPLLRTLLDGVLTVTEDQIAAAIVMLAERCKLIAEGAGAVAVAALQAGELEPVAGPTVAIVSGGNVDSALLAGLLLRHETEEGRRVRIFTRIPDRPGGLAELLGLVARSRANVVSVEHLRDAVPLHVRETGVELTLETRGPQHTREVIAELASGGYDARLDQPPART
ncbi:MAG: pyridoxal-phosphate dependent enzyme [Solirubrobacteraceae bacterium]